LPLAKSNVAPFATFAHPTTFHHPSVTPKVKSRVMILFHVRFTFFRAHSEQRDTRRATVEQASRVIGAIELPHLQGNVETGKVRNKSSPHGRFIEALYLCKEHPGGGKVRKNFEA
jgi:hypothetical protein